MRLVYLIYLQIQKYKVAILTIRLLFSMYCRKNIWGDTSVKLDHTDDNDLSKPFKIQFVGEPAVDHGGPSREFFSLINQHMQGSMLCGPNFHHYVVSLQKYEFMKCGQLAAKGLLQGSSVPKCFGKTVTDYILYGNLQCLTSLLELNQFIDGLKTCGVLDLIRSNPEQFRVVFQYGKVTLTADLLDDIFQPLFSPEGSNKRTKEERLLFNSS